MRIGRCGADSAGTINPASEIIMRENTGGPGDTRHFPDNLHSMGDIDSLLIAISFAGAG